MRRAFFEGLIELAEADDRVFLLTGDLGWSAVEGFAARHADRFLNVGVAEQNMAGVAAGLALAGFVPFVYSIAAFTSMRCYEQMRDGAVLHRLPVRFIGIGGGYAYGHAGPTHYALEDLAIARCQPGLNVIAPADAAQTRSVIRASAAIPGPMYLRVGKSNPTQVRGLDGRFALGRPELVRRGSDVLLLACGDIVHEALAAADLLASGGVTAAVAVLAHLPFAATDEVIELLRRFSDVVTLEEGYTAGGLGSLVAEAVACHRLPCRVTIRGVVEPLSFVSGSEAFMRTRQRLDGRSLAEDVARLLRRG